MGLKDLVIYTSRETYNDDIKLKREREVKMNTFRFQIYGEQEKQVQKPLFQFAQSLDTPPSWTYQYPPFKDETFKRSKF